MSRDLAQRDPAPTNAGTIGCDDGHHIHVTAVTIGRRIFNRGGGPHRVNAAPLSNTPAAALCPALPVCPRWRGARKEDEPNVSSCAGFRPPVTTISPRAPAAGGRKAPRHEIASAGSTTPVPRAMGIWRRGVTDDSRPLFRSSRNTTYTFRHECC
jgi:hypothetical protein